MKGKKIGGKKKGKNDKERRRMEERM